MNTAKRSFSPPRRRGMAVLLALAALAGLPATLPASAQGVAPPGRDTSVYPAYPLPGATRAGFRHHFWRGVPNQGLPGSFIGEMAPDAE